MYHANLNFTDEDGPVYIYLKDAGDYTTTWIESGLMVDIARENNGSLFTLDYRFFGSNRPTELVILNTNDEINPLHCYTLQKCII